MIVDPPRMLTVKQVAGLLACSPRYVREELIGKGKLKAIRYSKRGQWRIHVEWLDRMLNRSRPESNEDAQARREAELVTARRGWTRPVGAVRSVSQRRTSPN